MGTPNGDPRRLSATSCAPSRKASKSAEDFHQRVGPTSNAASRTARETPHGRRGARHDDRGGRPSPTPSAIPVPLRPGHLAPHVVLPPDTARSGRIPSTRAAVRVAPPPGEGLDRSVFCGPRPVKGVPSSARVGCLGRWGQFGPKVVARGHARRSPAPRRALRMPAAPVFVEIGAKTTSWVLTSHRKTTPRSPSETTNRPARGQNAGIASKEPSYRLLCRATMRAGAPSACAKAADT